MSRPRSTTRHRVKISATLDPALVAAVDAHLAVHPGLDRSTIIDDALRLWYAHQQEQALAEQYGAQPAPAVADEQRTWRRRRRTAASTRLVAETNHLYDPAE